MIRAVPLNSLFSCTVLLVRLENQVYRRWVLSHPGMTLIFSPLPKIQSPAVSQCSGFKDPCAARYKSLIVSFTQTVFFVRQTTNWTLGSGAATSGHWPFKTRNKQGVQVMSLWLIVNRKVCTVQNGGKGQRQNHIGRVSPFSPDRRRDGVAAQTQQCPHFKQHV